MTNEEARAYRDIEEIEEVMNCDADAETKCKMISNILTAKPHYFKEKEPCDKYIKEIDHLRKYIVKLETQIVEQEPCTDAISRQAVIDATTKYCVLYDLRELLADIETLPSINVAEKTGYWIKIKPYPLQMHDYECSECKHETDDNTEKYCSGCGCRMLVVKE